MQDKETLEELHPDEQGFEHEDQDEDGENDSEDDEEVDSDDKTGATAVSTSEYRRRPSLPGSYCESDPIPPSWYRDEFVIDTEGNLCSKLPRLSRASRQLMAETLWFSFDTTYKFVVQVDSFHTSLLFERQRAFRLLADACGVDNVTEANTTIVLDDRRWEQQNWRENLRRWLRKY
ncbi:hypothetical protein CC86DRAFT_406199 [Ophiobolus disseminans]|uniref:Uncharacterized protein n=1 Tax=Ophiobolus disseminans TaxID=1469910 RepID=A0A6A7A331_9PLEO|nr:hypothetical protein CC86DRAFT_406199 [Ophiobolus disseminans]